MRSSGMSVAREVGQGQIWGTPKARKGKRNPQKRRKRKEENQRRVLS